MQRTTTTSPRPGGSRFFASPPRAWRRGPRRNPARPAKRFAGQKTAPGIFFATTPISRPENLPQVTETHQENSVIYYGVVLGCVVAPNSTAGLIASTDPTFGLGGIRTATTTVQLMGRQVNGAPSGDLHGALLITGDGRAIVVSAQPSAKIHGWSEFENLLGIDVGITISPQDLRSPGQSGEFTQYQNSSTHDASPVFMLNQSFDQTVTQVNTFNSAVSSQGVPYLTRTQNSNSYAFTLLQVLTGTPYSAPSSYYGGRTWIPTPAAPTRPQ